MGKRQGVDISDRNQKSKKSAYKKAVVESPWNVGVSQPLEGSLCLAQVMTSLTELLQSFGFAEWEAMDKRRLKALDEHGKTRFAASKRSVRSLFAIGFNEVMRHMQKGLLSFVIAPVTSKPPHLVEALALCCLSSRVPVVLVDDFLPICKTLKISSCFTLGVLKPIEPSNESNEIQLTTYQTHSKFVSALLPQAVLMSSDLPLPKP